MIPFSKNDLQRFRQAHELLTDADFEKTLVDFSEIGKLAKSAKVSAGFLDFEGPLYNAWNLVIDAEHRFVELLPPPSKSGRPKKVSTPVDTFVQTPDQVYQLRKVYGGLPAEQLAELKAKAVETGNLCTTGLQGRGSGRKIGARTQIENTLPR